MGNRIVGDDLARLISKTDRTTDPNGCWPFTGARTSHGYGNMYFQGSVTGAHRVAYALFIGDAPKGMHVDHLCHTRDNCVGGSACAHRLCVRPSHLALVTHRDNNLRGHGIGGDNIRKTHCPRGHEYTSENTYVRPDLKPGVRSSRECLICRRTWKQRNDRW